MKYACTADVITVLMGDEERVNVAWASTVFGHPLFRSLARYACIEEQPSVTRFDIDAVAVGTRLDGECDHLSESHSTQRPGHCEPNLIASRNQLCAQSPPISKSWRLFVRTLGLFVAY